MLDERTRYFRRLRRLRSSARRWSVLAGGLTGITAVVVPYAGLNPADAIWAGMAGASIAFAWWRWSDARQLAAQPVPDPPDPALAGDRWLSVLAQVPGGYGVVDTIRRQRTRSALRGSAAADAWERLDRSARTMREIVGRLDGVDPDSAREAGDVERQLRDLTNRVSSLEQALRMAPAEAQPPLQELRDDHIAHLERGVAAYEQFVVAAAGHLSEASRAGGGGPDVTGLTAATERLRGVTDGLAELRKTYGVPSDDQLRASG